MAAADGDTRRDKLNKTICVIIHEKSVMIPEMFEGVSSRSGNDAPSRKGCVVDGQMTKARNK